MQLFSKRRARNLNIFFSAPSFSPGRFLSLLCLHLLRLFCLSLLSYYSSFFFFFFLIFLLIFFVCFSCPLSSSDSSLSLSVGFVCVSPPFFVMLCVLKKRPRSPAAERKKRHPPAHSDSHPWPAAAGLPGLLTTPKASLCRWPQASELSFSFF